MAHITDAAIRDHGDEGLWVQTIWHGCWTEDTLVDALFGCSFAPGGHGDLAFGLDRGLHRHLRRARTVAGGGHRRAAASEGLGDKVAAGVADDLAAGSESDAEAGSEAEVD